MSAENPSPVEGNRKMSRREKVITSLCGLVFAAYFIPMFWYIEVKPWVDIAKIVITSHESTHLNSSNVPSGAQINGSHSQAELINP